MTKIWHAGQNIHRTVDRPASDRLTPAGGLRGWQRDEVQYERREEPEIQLHDLAAEIDLGGVHDGTLDHRLLFLQGVNCALQNLHTGDLTIQVAVGGVGAQERNCLAQNC